MRWSCVWLWQAPVLQAAFHYYRLQAKGLGLKFKEMCLFFCWCTFTAFPINHGKITQVNFIWGGRVLNYGHEQTTKAKSGQA